MRTLCNSTSLRRNQLERCDVTKAQVERLIQAVFIKTGINLIYYKEDYIYKHFSDIMLKNEIHSPDVLIEKIEASDLSKSDSFINAVVDLVPARSTRFFRDFYAFDSVMELFSTPPCPSDLKILSAGCSSGEESFSIALSLLDKKYHLNNEFKISAVELSPHLLDRAKTGEYSIIYLDQIPSMYSKHIKISNDQSCFSFSNEVIERVEFVLGDLIDSDKNFFSPTRYHLVSLRYVVIFMKPDIAKIVLTNVSNSLTPGGILWMGVGEFIELPSHYSLKLVDASIYKRV